jgi:hypothetical protein
MIKIMSMYGQLICSNELVDVDIPCGIIYHIYQRRNSEHDKEGKIAGP